jgi:hypothetical protein
VRPPGRPSWPSASCWWSRRATRPSAAGGSSTGWSRRTGWWPAAWNAPGSSAWEQRLGELARRQEELARFKASRPTPLSTQEWRWLQTAGADLAAVWNAPTTSDRDRKQLLRCLITEVVVTVDRARTVADLTVVWVGGATSALSSKLNHSGGHRHATTAEVLELIRRLAVHYDDEQIAFTLNAKRLRTGKDNSFTARRVHHLRARHHIPGPDPAVTADRDDPAWMNVTAAATALGVSQDTVRRWAREGFVEAAQWRLPK